MRWVKVREDIWYDYEVHLLKPAAFKKAFFQALHGGGGPLAKYVRRDSGRPHAAAWAHIRAAVYERDDYTCHYCGERGKKLECDHVVPVSRGGTHDMENLVTACFKCNRAKRNKPVEEWRGSHPHH